MEKLKCENEMITESREISCQQMPWLHRLYIILSKAPIFNLEDKREKETKNGRATYYLRTLCYVVAEESGLWYLVNRIAMRMYFIFSLHGYTRWPSLFLFQLKGRDAT